MHPTGEHSNILWRDYLMGVQWEKDIDTGLARAQKENRAVLLDFSAAPM